MPNKKKIRVKVKKRKLKIKNILILLLLLILLYLGINYILHIKIKNIYIINNNIVPDKDIISSAKLDDYPSFLLTTSKEIENNILKNNYIKEVSVTKKIGSKVYIEIEEYRALCLYNNEIILESGNKVENTYNLILPVLLNDVNIIYDDFINYFSKVDEGILTKISEIEYVPNEVDNERFLLTMNDGNYVYITLTKITKLNKYNSIKDQLEGKLGIIYLDSGDYVEIKE